MSPHYHLAFGPPEQIFLGFQESQQTRAQQLGSFCGLENARLKDPKIAKKSVLINMAFSQCPEHIFP
jgi:hypothetical protein